MTNLTRRAVLPLIQRALREDQAMADVTSRAVLPRAQRIRARIVSRASGIVAGLPAAVWTFRAVDRSLRCVVRRREGARVRTGDTLMMIEGSARSIFAAERTALNLLRQLSGIATLTHEYVRRARPYR